MLWPTSRLADPDEETTGVGVKVGGVIVAVGVSCGSTFNPHPKRRPSARTNSKQLAAGISQLPIALKYTRLIRGYHIHRKVDVLTRRHDGIEGFFPAHSQIIS